MFSSLPHQTILSNFTIFFTHKIIYSFIQISYIPPFHGNNQAQSKQLTIIKDNNINNQNTK